MKLLILACLLSILSFAQVKPPQRTKTEAKQRMDSLYTKLIHGADFAALADAYSEDPGTAGQGGKYDNCKLGTFVPQFEKVIIKLKVNEISKPFLTQYGYHIAQLLKKQNDSFTVRHILIMFKE
jgi:parvulin-like peptidyl-prolyl isomerase